jgi:transposase
MIAVMIGVDPHKGSHTTTMLDGGEHDLRRFKVRAGARQVVELLAWADGVRLRTWAVESAGGPGDPLSQQLVAAGETVLNVPATLASRVQVLSTGQSAKSDANADRHFVACAMRGRRPSSAIAPQEGVDGAISASCTRDGHSVLCHD